MANIAVDIDASALIYVPSSATQWTTLLSGTGFSAPSSIWLAQESSGNLADSGSGARTLVPTGALSYQQTVPGFTRKGVKFADGVASYLLTTASNTATTSGMLLQIISVGTNPASGYRALNRFGQTTIDECQFVNGASGPKLRGHCGAANAADGNQQNVGTVVVVTKYDHTNSVLGIYTRGEQIKPTWQAETGTNLYLMGDTAFSTDSALVYAAYWSGTDAEITDAQIQTLIDTVYGDSTTLSKLQAGSCVVKYVAAIEGCSYLLSDAPSASVLTAWTGHDATQVLGGLYVDLKNSQSITPWDPFVSGGSCKLRVVPDSSDTFGVLVNKRAAGAETEITSTINRSDTNIPVASTADFTSSGDVFIGTECIGYTGKTATTFTGCTRGKYSPFGCETSGSGAWRFANHHRKGQDPNHVQMRPVVSQLPRVWIGKRVGVWMHTWDPVTNTLNSRDEAQLVYAGRIAGIADDPNDFSTVLDIEPVTEEMRNGVIGKDMWSATLTDGIDIVEGRTFAFGDVKVGVGTLAATALTVVASGATGTNQINAGRYSLSEICEKLSAWLAGEKAAGRIYGFYTWCSPVTSNVGLRTKCYWKIEHATDISCSFVIYMPGEVASFLGLMASDPGNLGQTVNFQRDGVTNANKLAQGDAVPFTNLIFTPTLGFLPDNNSGGTPQSITYDATDEVGTFVDQYDYLPANIKALCDSTKQWGVFLLNESVTIVGAYDAGVLSQCWVSFFELASDHDKAAARYFGRRADEPSGGKTTLRQVLVLEDTLSSLFAKLVYSTGTSGYNHGTYDVFSFGLGIPGEMLGGSFDRSLTNLPGADAPIALIIDEPTKFSDLFSADLVLRRSFIRWRDEAFEFAQWKTPVAALSVASLTESTKAAPAGQVENHRIASLESTENARPIVKLDYCRDFAVSRGDSYLKSFQIEDQTAVDDAGGNVKPFTLALRNTYHDLANTGSAIEALLPEFLSFMPVLARPFRMITRSIDQRFFEGYSVGDIMTVTDTFARDPLTGRRGISARPAMVSRLAYDPGGPNPDGTTRPQGGEIDLMFLDVHRGDVYAPAAQVDDTATNAGYNAGTGALTCYAQKYSHTITFTVIWGRGQKTFHITENADASNFVAGDKILICEIDPAVAGSPTYWERTVGSVVGNVITPTATLSAPAWDATKKYRITYQKYSQSTGAQQDHAFQAASANMSIEALDVPSHFCATTELYDYNEVSSTGLAAHLATMTYGDGRPWDVGNDRQLVYNFNEYIDRKSAHQGAFLWSTAVQSGLAGGSNTQWNTLFAGPISLGTEHTSATVTRTLTVAPAWRSYSGLGGGNAWLRITISRVKPQLSPGASELTLGGQYYDPQFTSEFSQTAQYHTTSSTLHVDTDAVLDIGVKDLEFGFAWLVIEGAGAAECRGLSKMIEGVRTVP